jgi:hypothetical protein
MCGSCKLQSRFIGNKHIQYINQCQLKVYFLEKNGSKRESYRKDFFRFWQHLPNICFGRIFSRFRPITIVGTTFLAERVGGGGTTHGDVVENKFYVHYSTSLQWLNCRESWKYPCNTIQIRIYAKMGNIRFRN